MKYTLVHYGLPRLKHVDKHLRAIEKTFGEPVKRVAFYWDTPENEGSKIKQSRYDELVFIDQSRQIANQLRYSEDVSQFVRFIEACYHHCDFVYRKQYAQKTLSQISIIQYAVNYLKAATNISPWILLTRPDIEVWGNLDFRSIDYFDYFYSCKHVFKPDGLLLIRSPVFLKLDFPSVLGELDSLFDASAEAVRDRAMYNTGAKNSTLMNVNYRLIDREISPLRYEIRRASQTFRSLLKAKVG